MRVLHVTPSVARSDGGPAEVIRGLLPALHGRGVVADVLTTDKGLAASDDDLTTASWVRHVASTGPTSVTFAPQLASAMSDGLSQYDVVHVHGFQSYPGTMAMRIARRAGIPYLIEPHGALDLYHWRENALRKRAWLRIADAKNVAGLSGAIYSSELEKQQALAVLPDIRAFHMNLAVDEQLFAIDKTTKNDGPAKILYLGRLTKKKRVDLVVRALAEAPLRRRGVRLFIAGGSDGTIEDPDALAREIGVGDRVTSLGPVDSARRRDLLAECDVFVLPSEDESFGVAVAEAMAAGARVVTSEHVGIAARARENRALRVARNDPASIAQAVVDALEDTELPGRAREHARREFRWSIAAAQAQHAYETARAGDIR
ncbi:MAG: glycosyltransferase [Microbacterium sp.]|jgi:glycosyltransferase involved in cell wall biosynthesis|nr:glycosyltransferase [Microbacterium sp.]MDF2916556.1 glycosyltransferase [Microbacterium sp.]